MSKYHAVRAVMGGTEDYNDATKYGRVLKWYHTTSGMSKPERDKLAGEILEKLINAGVYYVQKVQVRNARGSDARFDGNTLHCIEFDDDDKICVYIDKVECVCG